MNDNMSDYKDLIHLMEATPKATTPDHFTSSVMEAVMQARPRQGIATRAWNFLSGPRPHESTLYPIAAFRAGISKTELIWDFFIAGFAYAIIGTSLLFGLSEFKSATALSEWILWQPFFWLASALMFVFCGVALYTGGNRGFNIVRYYVFFHIGFVIINGIFISLTSALPLTIMFTVFFAMPTIIIGSSLFINKNKAGKLLTQGEIFSHAVR